MMEVTLTFKVAEDEPTRPLKLLLETEDLREAVRVFDQDLRTMIKYMPNEGGMYHGMKLSSEHIPVIEMIRQHLYDTLKDHNITDINLC